MEAHKQARCADKHCPPPVSGPCFVQYVHHSNPVIPHISIYSNVAELCRAFEAAIAVYKRKGFVFCI